ncbi:hypothetical protein MNBD_GAMMA12-1785 [hydrothermal vent metagenome]|uniref:Uncharacterized protein n=1 Tax=hydrothermal vent metagenome TaxID=652676 RepID=A0A3B0XU32_9ZZZZ
MKKDVVAIDTGYGFVKIVVDYDVHKEIFTEILFPSQSAYTFSEKTGQTEIDQTDVVTVKIGNQMYIAGPDIALHQRANHIQVLTHDYVHSKQYLTLNMAALAYSGATEIQYLVVGLPVDLLDAKKEFLIHLLKGKHQINSELSVTVKNVIPLAQPLGGLVYARQTNAINFRNDQEYLIIDPGYYTLDWFVLQGTKRNKQLSGHYPGGMSLVLEGIAKAISHEHAMDYRDFDAIDKGLRTKQFYINNKPANLSKYLNLALPYLEEPIQAMLNKIGSTQNFDSIIIVGGGGEIFTKILKAYFPSKKMPHINQSIFANARGFYLLGQQFNQTKGVKAS